jgi:hypothetical protein
MDKRQKEKHLYYLANKEKIRKKHAEYYKKHKIKITKRHKRYSKKHKDIRDITELINLD